MSYQVSTEHQVQKIPLDDIVSDSDFNCRGDFTPFSCVDLAQDIRELGLIQPITLHKNENGQLKIITGHRRHQAFKNLRSEFPDEDWNKIPAIIQEGLSEEDMRVRNLSENLKREDLNIMQEAEAIRFFQEKGYSHKVIAEKLGKSYGWTQVRLAFLKLPHDVQRTIAAGYIKNSDIQELARLNRADLYKAVRFLTDAHLKGVHKKKFKMSDIEGKDIEKPAPRTATRYKNQIEDLQDTLHEILGPCFITKLLGWAMCEVPTPEIHEAIRQYCKEEGLPEYFPPKNFVKAQPNDN